ncbi:MAG TPA: hypothetical protein ENN32_09495 [Chloroflexi bacterium]|nr:hypothetical protein [Chloroflexota bacterium]
MRFEYSLQARRDPAFFGITQPDIELEDLTASELNLFTSERGRTDRKSLFGLLRWETPCALPPREVDPTAFSRVNKLGGRY